MRLVVTAVSALAALLTGCASADDGYVASSSLRAVRGCAAMGGCGRSVDRQQYYDEQAGRYYYFDARTGRYHWENGAPRG